MDSNMANICVDCTKQLLPREMYVDGKTMDIYCVECFKKIMPELKDPIEKRIEEIEERISYIEGFLNI